MPFNFSNFQINLYLNLELNLMVRVEIYFDFLFYNNWNHWLEILLILWWIRFSTSMIKIIVVSYLLGIVLGIKLWIIGFLWYNFLILLLLLLLLLIYSIFINIRNYSWYSFWTSILNYKWLNAAFSSYFLWLRAVGLFFVLYF